LNFYIDCTSNFPVIFQSQNYTETGFKKMKAPKPLWNLLKNYWEANKENKEKENWGMGNVYTNNWKAPTYMVSVENRKLRAGGSSMKNKIWEAAKSTLEAWTGMKLQPTSLYGIRVYTEGAILAPHVDRLPLVSSCIINVAQDVEEDWVLEVYDRHDRAVNVTMEPGDMVLYESGSLLHGRPFALKGNFYANVFVHFEPTGEHLHDNGFDDVDDFYPPYLLLDSPEIDNWARRNPSGWRKHSPSAAGLARPKGHSAAALGDVDSLQRLAREDKNAMHTKDVNGWQPIHEAARAGNLKVVKLLVEKHGADVNSVTNFGEGSSVYNIAAQSFSPDHPVAIYLKSMGAKNIGPEL
jgi:prolyl 4-hydroxylase